MSHEQEKDIREGRTQESEELQEKRVWTRLAKDFRCEMRDHESGLTGLRQVGVQTGAMPVRRSKARAISRDECIKEGELS